MLSGPSRGGPGRSRVQAMEVRQREFAFTDRDFEFIRQLVLEQCGISLADHKRQLVYGRLTRRLRELRMPSFADYCRMLETDGDAELPQLVNSVTTNVTAFFREAHHFEFLSQQFLPEVKRTRAAGKRLRLWSAGCSSGEEPYSMAMTLAGGLADTRGWDVRILATDIDQNVLRAAAEGVYREDRMSGVPEHLRKRWFKRGTGTQAGNARVVQSIRDYVRFAYLNLMHDWPMKGPFDAVFCRNVIIYFDKDTKQRLVNRFADMLAPGGYLFIGHSESLHGMSDRFELIGRTIYKLRS